MTLEQKIKMALVFKGMTQADLARAIGTTPQAFNQRLKTERFTKEELEKMIAPSSYTGICSVLARELADKAEAKAKMMTEK